MSLGQACNLESSTAPKAKPLVHKPLVLLPGDDITEALCLEMESLIPTVQVS